MSKIFFTSDTHFGDSRLKIFSRPFNNIESMHNALINNWNNIVGLDDVVYHLGDFAVNPEGFKIAEHLNGDIHLILGNHDEENLGKFDISLFKSISHDKVLNIKGTEYYLVHKPTETIPDMFNLCGHIHGLWKVQRNMINCGVDAWHFLPISEEQIEMQRNGIVNYYDDNVFIAEYMCNRTAATLKLLKEYKE